MNRWMMRRAAVVTVTALAICGAAGAGTSVGGGSAIASGGQPESRTPAWTGPVVRSAGVATIAAQPDRAVLTLGVTHQDATSAGAQRGLSERLTKVLEAIKTRGAPGLVLQSQGLSLSPEYDFGQGGGRAPVITGYRASATVSVQVDDISKVGALLDAGIAAGANEVQGVSFTLKDDTALRLDALGRAGKDARQKAEALAAALGLSLREVVEASVGQPVVTPVWSKMGRGGAMMDMAMAPTPIEGGQVTVTVDVSVVFAAVAR